MNGNIQKSVLFDGAALTATQRCQGTVMVNLHRYLEKTSRKPRSILQRESVKALTGRISGWPLLSGGPEIKMLEARAVLCTSLSFLCCCCRCPCRLTASLACR